MPRLRITLAPRQIFRTDFGPEWLAVMLIALVAAVWARCVHFDLAVAPSDFRFPVIIIIGILATHALMSRRAGLVAEYFLLTVLATAVFGVLSYLSMTTGRPLADGVLSSADRVLGFDWIVPYRWLVNHRSTAKVLQLAYDSLVYQGLYFGVFFGVMGQREKLREMFWLVAIAGLLTSAGAALFPALGPFKAHGVRAEFLPAMEQLRSGNLHFTLAKLTGVVSFPSFHTTMALLYIYGFRRTGAIGWAAAGLNLLMLPAIPFFGGHYLVDMFAGAGVALASLVLVRAWTTRHVSASLTDGVLTDPSPVTTALYVTPVPPGLPAGSGSG